MNILKEITEISKYDEEVEKKIIRIVYYDKCIPIIEHSSSLGLNEILGSALERESVIQDLVGVLIEEYNFNMNEKDLFNWLDKNSEKFNYDISIFRKERFTLKKLDLIFIGTLFLLFNFFNSYIESNPIIFTILFFAFIIFISCFYILRKCNYSKNKDFYKYMLTQKYTSPTLKNKRVLITYCKDYSRDVMAAKALINTFEYFGIEYLISNYSKDEKFSSTHENRINKFKNELQYVIEICSSESCSSESCEYAHAIKDEDKFLKKINSIKQKYIIQLNSNINIDGKSDFEKVKIISAQDGRSNHIPLTDKLLKTDIKKEISDYLDILKPTNKFYKSAEYLEICFNLAQNIYKKFK
jgi:hypothetical protein